jgi:hypothetical protein
VTEVERRPAESAQRWKQLAVQLAPGAAEWELEYLGEVCRRLDLSPFTNPAQICLIGRFDKRAGRVVHRPMVTIDGRLALAVRSGRVVGIEGPTFTGPRDLWTDSNGQRIWIDGWDCRDEGGYPRAARYLIHVSGWATPANGTAPWAEFSQRDSAGKLTPMWARWPTTMLAKSALSLGLRRSGVENMPAGVPVDYEGDSSDPDLIVPALPTPDDERPPEEIYDSSPEAAGYDPDVQPASYDDPEQ